MINRNIKNYFIISILILSALSFTQGNVFASSTISMGTAGNYAILSGAGPSTGVITNGVTGQTITGFTGHNSTLTAPFTYSGMPLGNDVTSSTILGDIGSVTTPIGDAHAALVSIGLYTGSAGNNTGLQCTFSFANGTAVDLATDTTHGQIGQYARGVYCINGAASIGDAGITLNGTGTGQYIFKINGALTSVTQSHVTLSGGTLASDVFWAPKGGASLGANTSFQGTILSGPAAITLGADADLNQGRLVSESAVTIEGGVHTITIPGGATLSSIAITAPATKSSYTVGDMLDTTGLQVTGTFSSGPTSLVTPDSVTGFNSAAPAPNQVLTIHVGSQTTTYTINVVARPTISIPIGTASTYAIIAGTSITNNVPNQPVTGDTGHVSGLTSLFTYNGLPLGTDHAGAGTVGTLGGSGTPLGDAHAALQYIGLYTGSANSGLSCSFNFTGTAVDLAADTTHGQIGQYTPGVYCINGAASIGTAGITLSGNGTYVFKINGALNTVPSSQVTLSGGANANNVFWAPIAATTLGANTLFQGTVLNGAAAITLQANADVNQGRLISESAVTINGGVHNIVVPGGLVVTLSSITITAPATKTSYFVGDALDITGLVVTGIYSDGSTNVLTIVNGNVAGFSSAAPTPGQVLTIQVGSKMTTYTINVSAVPLPTVSLGTAGTYVLLSGDTSSGTIENGGIFGQLISGGNVGHSGAETTNGSFTFTPGFGDFFRSVTLGTSLGGPGTPLGDAHAARLSIGTVGANGIESVSATGLACTFAFQTGNIDLASNANFSSKVYPPGVYCIDGIMSIGAANEIITLTGNGPHIFKSNGAFNTAANDNVDLANGAQAANVFWVPSGAATLGGTNFFNGTILTGLASAITTGGADKIVGRLMSETDISIGGGASVISAPSALLAPDTTPPTVSITSPMNGTVITHLPFTISGTASDNVAVDHVTVTIDGTPVTVTGTTSWTAPSGTLSNTVHAITATSFDTAGNSNSTTIHVTVNTAIINSQSVSASSTTGKGSVSSTTDAGTFTSFTPVSESTLSTGGKPTGVTFPYGFFSFNVAVPFGATIHVTQTFPSPLPVGTKYWKIESGVWTDETSLASISGNTLTLTLTDGLLGDSDHSRNGVISDPGGISIPAIPTIDLGTANTFGILASTYTNTVTGVIVNGDLGYTTGPAVTPVIFGTTYVSPNPIYSQAGSAEGTALSNVNSKACTVNLGTTVHLASAQPGGVYTPGVYCTTGAADIETPAGITLSGNGIYIFKINGALTTVANSHVTLTGGADANNVFWAPTQATTLGANSVFAGTDIDDSGITIGSTVTWTGRALAFGGTVTTGGADTFTTPPTSPVVPIQFSMPSGSGSNSPSESRPSLGGTILQTFSDGLKINGHVFDVSKFHNPVPQQIMPLNQSVTITVKQTMTRGAQTWQHVMLFMNFGGKDTISGNADTWMIIDKKDGVQVHDPHNFVTNVGIHNVLTAYEVDTTFTFTPVKQMSDSNMIIRVWDNRLMQTDAYVMGAIVFGNVPIAASPVVKPDWIQVFTNLKDADNAVESAGYLKPVVFAHISTVNQVWTVPNTGHVLWFFDTKDAQAALYIYDSNGNVMEQMMEPLVKVPAALAMGQGASFAGNHLSITNTDAMNKALAQQQLNAKQTIDYLGYNR
jgi:hypothetical protein